MTEPRAGSEPEPLQFDRAVPADAGSGGLVGAVVCQMCGQQIATQYYQVNGAVLCERCKDIAVAALSTPLSPAAFMRGTLFGVGAAIAGAAIYYGFYVVSDGREWSLISILIGYMVGAGIRKGAGGGGRRFQFLAVILTYLSVGLAYTAMMFQSRSSAVTLATAAIMVVSLPVVSILRSGVSALLFVIIVGIGLLQAWRMTAASSFTVTGPFNVGIGVRPAIADGT